MRVSLRATLVAILLPLALFTAAMSTARIADLAAVRADVRALRDSASRSIYAERHAHQLHVVLEEAYEVLVGQHVTLDALDAARTRARETLARMQPLVDEASREDPSAEGLTSGVLDEWAQTQTEIDRHLERAFALAASDRGAQARRLVVEDLEVLLRGRVFSPLGTMMQREQELLEERRVRATRATEHWVARMLGASDLRQRLLPDVYEAILAERFARAVHADFRAFMYHVLEGRPLDPSRATATSEVALQLLQMREAREARGGAADVASPRFEDVYAGSFQEVRSAYAEALALPAGELRRTGPGIVAHVDAVLEQSLMPAIAAFVIDRERAIEAESARLDGFARMLALLMVALAVATLVVAVGGPLLAAKLLIAPVDDLVETLRRFREGEGDVRPRVGAKNELGVLAASLRRLLDEQQQASRKVRALVFYDSATGLPNRQFFQERLQGALLTARVQGRSMALLAVNLAGLKQINETLGHNAGDDLVRQIATRLRDCVRVNDIVARPEEEPSCETELSRLGGDEFTILLTKISQANDATIAAQRVLSQLAAPFEVEGRQISVHTSIGIGIYPQDGADASTLLRNASAAMNSAVARGANVYQFFSEAMNLANARKLQIQSRLAGAIERGDLALHYQPVRRAEGGDLTGAEALLRWTDAEMGPIGPDEFIPIAEQAGFISRIGSWVLAEACAQARAWQDAGFSDIRMSVNVSVGQLRDPGWVESVARTLRGTGLSPGCLEIEITETAILHDESQTIEALTEVSQMGVSVVLDDFGTGYSSLSHLRHLPISRLKIDRSFVSEVSDDGEGGGLPSAIITLAHGLGLKVVAEGVETQGQANYLRSSGCDELQGYLISRPVPPAEFERFLDLKP